MAILAPAAKSQTSSRPHPALGTWLPALGLALLAGTTLMLTGVGWWETARLLAAVSVQTTAGATLWRWVRAPARVPWTEAVGLGVALGCLTSLISAQLVRPTALSPVGWALPAVGCLAVAAFPRARRRLAAAPVDGIGQDEALSGALGVLAGAPFLWTFWRDHPLEWTGWWGYYVDIPFHEALSVSLARWGPGDNILDVGSPLRYHWFAHAWAGTTTDAASAGSFVVMTRLLPLVALVGMVLLVVSWARTLSRNPAVPYLAVVLVVLGTDVATPPPAGLMQIFALSPSTSLAAMWLLAAAMVVTEVLSRRLRLVIAWPVLALLAVADVGGKSSNAAALVSGTGLVALVSLFPRALPRRTAWLVVGCVLAATATAYVVLLTGTAGNLHRGLGASAQAFAFLPAPGPKAGVVIGTLAVGLSIAAKWAGVGVLALDRRTRTSAAVWLAVGAGTAGLFLMAVLVHPGSSQLYFPLSASVLVGVVSAWGLGVALERLAMPGMQMSTVGGLAACLIGLARFASAPEGKRWQSPVIVWLAAAAVAVIVVAVTHAPRARTRTLIASFAAALTVAAVASGVIAAGDHARQNPLAAPAADAPLALSDTQRSALVWLRRHSDPDDVVATNRQCSGPHIGDAEPCPQARWFWTATLTHRRMYIEGIDYAASTIPPPVAESDKVMISRRFVDAPTAADARTLWGAGVRWVVVDIASTERRDWAPFATVAHHTATTDVLRLVEATG